MILGRQWTSGLRREEARVGWLLVAPVLLVSSVLVLYPLGVGFSYSLQSLVYGSGIPDRFVGLRNYTQVATQSSTIAAAEHTFFYLIIAITLEITGGLILALALNRPFRGRTLAFAVLILPWALPAVVRSTVWTRILASNNGLLNGVLYQLHLLGTVNHDWFANTVTAIFLITIVHVSGVLPLTTLIILAGLQTIPDDLYASAAVDGATAVQQFRRVTLPLLRSALVVAFTIGTVQAIQLFDEIYVLNGAAANTRSIALQVYFTTFEALDFGHGEALVFLLTFVVVLLFSAYLLVIRKAQL